MADRADVVASGKFLHDFDVRSEAGAGEYAFEEVVAEQRRIWRPAGQSGFECVDVVDAFAGEEPSPNRSW